jgi:hypothetical protein
LQVVSEEPTPPGQLHPHLSRDLEVVCLKCLRKQPAERYASAEELAYDLGQFLDGKRVRARQLSGRERIGQWLSERLAPKIMLGFAALYLLLAAVVDARSHSSFTAVPLTTVVVVLFLWPRGATFTASLGIGIMLLCAGSVPEEGSFAGVALNLGLSIGRGLLLGVVGLGVSRFMGRDRVLTTLGALFGFAIGFRGLATALLRLLSLTEVRMHLLQILAFGFAMPDLPQGASIDPLLQGFPLARSDLPRRPLLGFAEVAVLNKAGSSAVVSTVLLIVAIGFLPAVIGALVGGAVAERRQWPRER